MELKRAAVERRERALDAREAELNAREPTIAVEDAADEAVELAFVPGVKYALAELEPTPPRPGRSSRSTRRPSSSRGSVARPCPGTGRRCAYLARGRGPGAGSSAGRR